MTYATVEKLIQSVPEEYLEEISDYIGYILFKVDRDKEKNKNNSIARFFGCIEESIDGLAIQKEMRDEWN